MGKSRLEAFSDGVMAIIITIMVLELKAPEGANWQALKKLAPIFFTYALSYTFIGIYWINHHHLLHTTKNISAGIMWANLTLLFWISLIPFATSWVDENHFEPFPVSVYAALLCICGLSYVILQVTVEARNKDIPALKEIMKSQRRKGLISFIINFSAIPLAYVNPVVTAILLISNVVMWVVPDKKIENL